MELLRQLAIYTLNAHTGNEHIIAELNISASFQLYI